MGVWPNQQGPPLKLLNELSTQIPNTKMDTLKGPFRGFEPTTFLSEVQLMSHLRPLSFTAVPEHMDSPPQGGWESPDLFRSGPGQSHSSQVSITVSLCSHYLLSTCTQKELNFSVSVKNKKTTSHDAAVNQACLSLLVSQMQITSAAYTQSLRRETSRRTPLSASMGHTCCVPPCQNLWAPWAMLVLSPALKTPCPGPSH